VWGLLKLLIKMARKYIIAGVFIFSIFLLGFLFIYFLKQKDKQNFQDDFKVALYQNNPIKTPILGEEMMFGFGTPTESPYPEKPYQIPRPKFYIAIAEPNKHCVVDICGIDGSFIKTIGGWIQVYNTKFVETKEFFGLDLPENKNIEKMTIIGDNTGKIMGIYHNKGLKDVIEILKLHSDLANFSLIKGQKQFGELKVGEFSPLKTEFGKKFYLYAFQGISYDKYSYLCFLDGCEFPKMEPDINFLSGVINKMGGGVLVNSKYDAKDALLFGLNPQEVLSGKSSLVVLTDPEGKIIAIHPNKTLSDTITILSQYPNIVNLKDFYN